MVDVIKYVPVVKWKGGEKLALKNLNQNLKNYTIPLIELVNDEGDTPDKLTDDIRKFWPDSNSAYVDIHYRGPKRGLGALSNILDFPNGVDIIPVVRTDTSLILHEVIKNIVLANRNGLAVRIVVKEDDDFEITSAEIEALLKALSQTKATSDLIIDFQYISASIDYSKIASSIASSIDLSQWRRVIVTAGVFPDYLTEFVPDADNFLDRSEWKLWNEFMHLFKRHTVFSDYTCRHPIFYPKPANRGSQSLRYSLDDKYQIFRGKIQDKTYKRLAHSLNEVSLYGDIYPRNFSWGDEFIHEKAEQFSNILMSGQDVETADIPAGSQEQWVAATVNHHIAVVLKRNLHI